MGNNGKIFKEETPLDPTPEEKPNHVTSTQMNEAQPKRVMPGVNMMPGNYYGLKYTVY